VEHGVRHVEAEGFFADLIGAERHNGAAHQALGRIGDAHDAEWCRLVGDAHQHAEPVEDGQRRPHERYRAAVVATRRRPGKKNLEARFAQRQRGDHAGRTGSGNDDLARYGIAHFAAPCRHCRWRAAPAS
jgi:hypothetical protein